MNRDRSIVVSVLTQHRKMRTSIDASGRHSNQRPQCSSDPRFC